MKKKNLKGKHFAEGETKASRTTKGHQNQQVKNRCEQWEKHLNRYIASSGEYFEGD